MSKEQNPFSIWTDLNKQMLDAWTDWAAKAVPAASADGKTENPFSAYFDFFSNSLMQSPFLKGMKSDGSDFANQIYKNWVDGMQGLSAFIPNQNVKDGFERFMNAFNVMSGLSTYWNNFLKNIPVDMKDWDAFSKNAMQQYQAIAKNMSAAFAPEQLKGMLSMPMESFNTISQTLTQLFQPWIEGSGVLQENLLKAMSGDKDAYLVFLDEWSKMFKDSAGKMLNMPVVGANRASIEKMMKLLDDYVRFAARYSELSALFSGMTTTAMERILNKLSELTAEGKQPQTFMEFYSLWSNFNEEVANEVYSTEAFARIMNETVSAGSKLQIMFDDFMQDMLAFLPIPNRRELDDVELEVYKLRKTVKTLEKELKDVKALLASQPKATT